MERKVEFMRIASKCRIELNRRLNLEELYLGVGLNRKEN